MLTGEFDPQEAPQLNTEWALLVDGFALLQLPLPAGGAPIQQGHQHVQERRHGRPAWVCLRIAMCGL